ncbi:MAG: hypothetical protein H0Z33_15690 [Bacillaceae bacterium]|nr:hypothetical protein [Bacillaceae bacterium]
MDKNFKNIIVAFAGWLFYQAGVIIYNINAVSGLAELLGFLIQFFGTVTILVFTIPILAEGWKEIRNKYSK